MTTQTEKNSKVKLSTTFHDKEGLKVKVDATIDNGRFSIMGSSAGSCGQITFVSANEWQKQLLAIWEEWHLKRELPNGFEDNLRFVIMNIESAEKETPNTIEALMEEQGIDKDMQEACEAYLECMGADNLDDFEESYCGEFDSDEAFAEDMADNLGQSNDNMQWPFNHIDWEGAAYDLMFDYSTENDHYFRNY